MSDSRWQRIKDLFADAIALEPGEREVLLAREGATDPELRREVESLLRAHRPSIGAESDAETLSERPGMHVGPYKLLEEIGEGGFGVVFLAEQESPVRRRVALKVIKPGMDTRQVVARFEQERQALAMMDHPGIARVFDAGTTASGRPYFVMELVRGDPITIYCDREKLTTAERLRLFAEVCRAVQHAHQKGVIHRDLKPGNVLVTIVDGKPVPKVIDFGVAKATQGRLTDKTLFTAHRQIIGTPLYMSPEQAQLSGVDVDTRSDVYSLGVLLYELLVGVPPFGQEQLMQAGFAEMYRMIRELEPQKPSTRVATLGPSSTAVAAQRGVEARKLGMLLRGDLDWIVMRCLEKERARRYDTASDLAQDLERHLAGEPVEAAPPSAVYRLRKLVRRRRTAFAAGAAIVVVALAGGAGTIFQTASAMHAESKRAEAEAGRAASEARRAADAIAAESRQRGLAEAATRSAAEAETARAEAEGKTRKAEENAYVAAVMGAAAAQRVGEPATLRRLLGRAPEGLRGWEWRYLKAQSDSSLFAADGAGAEFSPDGTRIVTVSGVSVHVWDANSGEERACLEHPAHVSSAVFSPDGTRIVTSCQDNWARVWDVSSQSELARLAHRFVDSATFNSDGTRIVTAGWGETARLWDALTGQELPPLEGHAFGIYFAAFSDDGTRIVAGCGDNTVRVWETSTGNELARVHCSARPFYAAISPDGTRIVSASQFESASVWDAASGKELVHVEGRDVSYSVAFSRDGSRIVTAASDKTAPVIDATSGSEITRLVGHVAGIHSVDFSSDGTRIVTASEDETARVWDAESGQELARLQGHTSTVSSAKFSPDGKRIITAGDGTVRVWDTNSGKENICLLARPIVGATVVEPSPTGTRAVMVCGKSARVWDVNSGSDAAYLLEGHTEDIKSAAFSLDGKWIVTSSGDKTARVWDANTGKDLELLEGHTAIVYSAAFSSDGARIVTAAGDGTALVWDAKLGKVITRLETHTAGVTSARFSPDGTRVITACGDTMGSVWDAGSGKELASLEGLPNGVLFAVFSPDGSRIVAASRDTTTHVWDAISRKEIARLWNQGWGATFAVFSPDGARVIMAAQPSKVPRVWDVNSGTELARLQGHVDSVVIAAFSPDGTRIVTASRDKTARVWDADSGIELVRLQHTSDVRSAAFSPDGTRVITMCGDGSISVWDSVPNHVRHAERAARSEVLPDVAAEEVPEAEADEMLAHLLQDTGDWTLAATKLRADESLSESMHHAALSLLTRRANVSYLIHKQVEEMRAGSLWMSRIVGRKAWPSEREVDAEVSAEDRQPKDAWSLNHAAWRLVDPDAPSCGSEVRALLLARRAVAAAVDENAAPQGDHANVFPVGVSGVRNTLARALFRLGRFDEALEEQRRALADAPESSKEEIQELLSRLESDIATWRDESGHLREAEITSRIQSQDREAETLEQDPDVRLWLGKDR